MLQINGLLFALSALVLVGCASSALEESGSIQVDSEISHNQTVKSVAIEAGTLGDCGAKPFEDWPNWTRINDDLLHSEGHRNSWVDIFVNDLAEDTYLSAAAPYAECSIVVKLVYSGEHRDRLSGIAVMVKMPAGYDPDNGDWWYGKLDYTGKYVILQGVLEDCIQCHQGASETDYMFSRDVLQAASE